MRPSASVLPFGTCCRLQPGVALLPVVELLAEHPLRTEYSAISTVAFSRESITNRKSILPWHPTGGRSKSGGGPTSNTPVDAAAMLPMESSPLPEPPELPVLVPVSELPELELAAWPVPGCEPTEKPSRALSGLVSRFKGDSLPRRRGRTTDTER
jgi:hypothetical protein